MNRTKMTNERIMELCGPASAKKGHEEYEAGHVLQLTFDADQMTYDAVVSGKKKYHVRMMLDPFGDLEATCECAAFQKYYSNCQHIAAVLYNVMVYEQGARNEEPEKEQHRKSAASQRMLTQKREHEAQRLLTNQFLTLFDEQAWENPHAKPRENLQVELICHAITDPLRPSIITIQMRIGPKKLYNVQDIGDFLRHVREGQSMAFTRLFTYDPTQYAFDEHFQAVLQRLMEIEQYERLYRDSWGIAPTMTSYDTDRELMIPPQYWSKLLPRLVEIGAVYQENHVIRGQLSVAPQGNRLPIRFIIQGADQGYRLSAIGFERLLLLDSYGYAVLDDVWYALSERDARQLASLQQIMQKESSVLIMRDQMSSFMERVLPFLDHLGTVQVEEGMKDKLQFLPLQAKIYLDRSAEDNLLVRAEFVYGSQIFEQKTGEPKSALNADILCIRDSDKERLITALIESIPAKSYRQGYLFEHEEDTYNFLYHVLPELERYSEIYATTAVQEVMYTPSRSTSGPRTTVSIKGEGSWLEVGFQMEDVDRAEIQLLVQAIIEKKKYYRLRKGTFVNLDQEAFHEVGRLLDQLGVTATEVRGPQIAMPVLRGLQLIDEEAYQGIRFGNEFRSFLDQLRHPERLECEMPSGLAATLRDYQQVGFHWMKTLARYQFGGILADDMGLGKTLQSITFMLSEQEREVATRKPILIVAPASLVYNWERECHKFAPSLRVSVVVGEKDERAAQIGALHSKLIEHGGRRPDVLITSYPLLRRDIDHYEQHTFGALFLDEAQAIKNHASLTSKTVRQVRAQQKFALTGTPIENSLEELWSIFDAIFPELFGTKQKFQELATEQVARMVRPFILRRMKRDVLAELPEKIETLQVTALSEDQKKLYTAYLERLRKQTKEDMQEEGFQKNRMKILAGLTRLRQLCCHPALFVEDYEGSSSKMEQLFDLIEEGLSSGRRMLIFSQFTGMLDLIHDMLGCMGISCFYLAGDTPVEERLTMCNRFNDGEHDIFLISLKAGGTGLNLTGADTVILYDLWWNPAVEQQATDRAHRMGQKKVVQVIRLVTQGTVEEKMYELQQKKKDLIDEVIHTGEGGASSLTEEDIREILML
ncbi:DEAD/DEAH box helicase [Paenibacillus guangzhouensis]|uniref:DEAD/DEAH box helicase n=1 Tax=Paenibacillus guangzhouensis TaxID=1473112 RepID=UPI001266E41F|nr:DEAD/DEAH box helicase [Paenibacillus guangzhouensis]